MKQLLISICLLLLSAPAFSQVEMRSGIPYKDGNIFYERIVMADSSTKDQLFSAAKAAIAKVFKSANDVIQSTDKDAGVIIGKGNYSYSYTYMMTAIPIRAKFTMEIKAKDGKYRIQLSDFDVKQGNPAVYACPLETNHAAYAKDKKWAVEFFKELNAGAEDVIGAIATEIGNYSGGKKDDF